jgi:hypothetical protein
LSSAGHPLVFGSINARSIANQLDDLLEIRRHLLINVLFVVETWHDADSALTVLKSLIDHELDWRLTSILYGPTTAAWLLLARPEYA